jgi:hypothetical protein
MAAKDTAADADEGDTDEATDMQPIEAGRDELQAAIPQAAGKLTELLEADDERVQIRAAEAILDRAGLTKAQSYSRVTAQVQVGGGERESKAGLVDAEPLEEPDEDEDFMF